jgi:hypothetical protein
VRAAAPFAKEWEVGSGDGAERVGGHRGSLDADGGVGEEGVGAAYSIRSSLWAHFGVPTRRW